MNQDFCEGTSLQASLRTLPKQFGIGKRKDAACMWTGRRVVFRMKRHSKCDEKDDYRKEDCER